MTCARVHVGMGSITADTRRSACTVIPREIELLGTARGLIVDKTKRIT